MNQNKIYKKNAFNHMIKRFVEEDVPVDVKVTNVISGAIKGVNSQEDYDYVVKKTEMIIEGYKKCVSKLENGENIDDILEDIGKNNEYDNTNSTIQTIDNTIENLELLKLKVKSGLVTGVGFLSDLTPDKRAIIVVEELGEKPKKSAVITPFAEKYVEGLKDIDESFKETSHNNISNNKIKKIIKGLERLKETRKKFND